MEIAIVLVLLITAITGMAINIIGSPYIGPITKKKYKASFMKFDGMREDYSCWFNNDLKAFQYKEFKNTYTMYPKGKCNGYFTKSWEPLDKKTLEYYNKD